MGKHKNGLKGIMRVVGLSLIGLLLGIGFYTMNASQILRNQLPMPFGYGMAVVLSGSMEPELTKGDLIIVAKEDSYELNDVIVFQDGHSLVVHRIIEMNDDEIITKGDSNNVEDTPITNANVRGKVVFAIPYLGNVISFIKKPVGVFCMIFTAILILEASRWNDLKLYEEEKKRIVDEIHRLKENKNERDEKYE